MQHGSHPAPHAARQSSGGAHAVGQSLGGAVQHGSRSATPAQHGSHSAAPQREVQRMLHAGDRGSAAVASDVRLAAMWTYRERQCSAALRASCSSSPRCSSACLSCAHSAFICRGAGGGGGRASAAHICSADQGRGAGRAVALFGAVLFTALLTAWELMHEGNCAASGHLGTVCRWGPALGSALGDSN